MRESAPSKISRDSKICLTLLCVSETPGAHASINILLTPVDKYFDFDGPIVGLWTDGLFLWALDGPGLSEQTKSGSVPKSRLEVEDGVENVPNPSLGEGLGGVTGSGISAFFWLVEVLKESDFQALE